MELVFKYIVLDFQKKKFLVKRLKIVFKYNTYSYFLYFIKYFLYSFHIVVVFRQSQIYRYMMKYFINTTDR